KSVMKKFNLFCFSISLLLVMSCSDENEVDIENSISLVESSINCSNGNPTQDFIIFPNQFFTGSSIDLSLPIGVTWDRCVVVNSGGVRIFINEIRENDVLGSIFNERSAPNTGRFEIPSSVLEVGKTYTINIQVEIAPFTFVNDESTPITIVDNNLKTKINAITSLNDSGTPGVFWNKDAFFTEEIELEFIFNGVSNGTFLTANDGRSGTNGYLGFDSGEDNGVRVNICSSGNFSDTESGGFFDD
ncbi:MAG: hypothetical protein AAF363_03690, partial [Bacteroidota bacterium]